MSQEPEFSWKNSRILVADDEPDMREIFAAWFRNLGCSVIEVPDGQAALDALAAAEFDAIVTDVRMPHLDGIQLVKRLQHSGKYTPVVIFVSGFTDLEISDAFDLGVEALLSKPCERKELLHAVKRSLLRRDLVFSVPDSLQPPAPENYIRSGAASATADFHVSLGRGGMSLDLRQSLPAGTAFGFSLSSGSGSFPQLDGWGLLRWCDPVPGGTRVGIEFLYLDQQSREQFALWLTQRSPVSFIPKKYPAQTAASP